MNNRSALYKSSYSHELERNQDRVARVSAVHVRTSKGYHGQKGEMCVDSARKV